MPPGAARAGGDRGTLLAELEEGTYDERYRDREGRAPGEEGFVSPLSNRPLPAGAYDDGYRDSHGRKAGQPGFLPPGSRTSLATGLDANFVDVNGRTSRDPDFAGPTYGADYVDRYGLSPGDEGFTPTLSLTAVAITQTLLMLGGRQK